MSAQDQDLSEKEWTTVWNEAKSVGWKIVPLKGTAFHTVQAPATFECQRNEWSSAKFPRVQMGGRTLLVPEYFLDQTVRLTGSHRPIVLPLNQHIIISSPLVSHK